LHIPQTGDFLNGCFLRCVVAIPNKSNRLAHPPFNISISTITQRKPQAADGVEGDARKPSQNSGGTVNW
jgi:hypothetical protein